MWLAEAIAKAAESKVGIHEQGGNNQGPDLAPFFAADSYHPSPDSGYAWCAAFACWCVKTALGDAHVTFERPTTPGAWDFERWAREQDRSVMLKKPTQGDIQRGDLVVYTFSHIGVATGPPDKNGNVPTVEGNTNKAGSREGDGVFAKTRRLDEIRSRIRFIS